MGPDSPDGRVPASHQQGSLLGRADLHLQGRVWNPRRGGFARSARQAFVRVAAPVSLPAGRPLASRAPEAPPSRVWVGPALPAAPAARVPGQQPGMAEPGMVVDAVPEALPACPRRPILARCMGHSVTRIRDGSRRAETRDPRDRAGPLERRAGGRPRSYCGGVGRTVIVPSAATTPKSRRSNVSTRPPLRSAQAMTAASTYPSDRSA